ncbi:MarR family winged helix-turn-helix transcriptional regulator [Alicyclobacillus vulcanalis]|uniref:Transcriptional regulator, MarR family n=1 Tax=Alicyclobacillus vulcanalis TaxID=252246 RepID=A0A1N7KTP2_9BACL|nr:MarR family transcriptional regulator [Alicyclobacillus vulcanalis]SIS64800.1 transcriptional regulator, MarR family [Alicyclobacillus vulcanalis]
MNGDRLDIAQRLDTIIERFFRGMRSHFTEDKHGLTHTQAFVLRHLSLVPQAKSSDLARISGLSPGAITQVCDELVRLGFVERMRSSEDRRVVYVILTDRGRMHLRELTKDRAAKIAQLLDKLGEHDARKFLELLERLVSILDEQPCGSNSRPRQEGQA